MAVIRVDPDDLRAAASDVGDGAALVGRAFESRTSDLAVSRHAAWSASGVLSSAVEAWHPFLKGLRDSLQGSAEALRAMAERYVAAEWSTVERQRRMGGWIDE